jgi:pSer/pThr/pTyr-binding forkhead associated (FHA) protein
MHARLYCPLGEHAGTELAFDQEISVGRRSENNLILSSGLVSGRHALIRPDNDSGAWYIEDLNSTNGTFVAGRPIEESTRLLSLDVVSFGGLEFVFHSEGMVDPPGPKKLSTNEAKTTVEELPPDLPNL